jgi:sulfate adenylyltransferase subunit 2
MTTDVDAPPATAAAVQECGATVWLTGLPSAGKTTIALALAERLRAEGHRVEVLDGDEVRTFLSAGLGFSAEDRDTNIQRIGYVAELLAPVIAPYAASRAAVAARHTEQGTPYLEVHVATPVEVCSVRDVKGLYAKQAAGEISGLTGVDDPYEAPTSPDLRIEAHTQPVADSAAALHALLAERGLAGSAQGARSGTEPKPTPRRHRDRRGEVQRRVGARRPRHEGCGPAPAAEPNRSRHRGDTVTTAAGFVPPSEFEHPFTLSHLDALEAEAVHIFREVAGEFERPVILFSGGKDSIVMLHLALKAFWPAPVPFALLHVDTGHNFPEVLAYRDRTVAEHGLRLHVASVQDFIDSGRLRERPDGLRNPLQTVPLLDGIETGRFDAVFGGGRRDEEKARAKERVFSLRDEFGAWDPRRQRPELWSLYNGRHSPGEHVRVFPLSNWTELDVWQYIEREQIELPAIYYAHEREVFTRNGMWLTAGEWGGPKAGEVVERRLVRYRTVGDMSCTGAVDSEAATVAEVITEVAASRLTERGATRADDKMSEAAMEDRKREGYF